MVGGASAADKELYFPERPFSTESGSPTESDQYAEVHKYTFLTIHVVYC